MLMTTTSTLDGHKVNEHLGIVSGEAIMGAHALKDIFAGLRDVFGGRAGAYEEELRKAKAFAIDDMMQQAVDYGANAIVGVHLDYESVADTMMMVVATGMAVIVDDGAG